MAAPAHVGEGERGNRRMTEGGTMYRVLTGEEAAACRVIPVKCSDGPGWATRCFEEDGTPADDAWGCFTLADAVEDAAWQSRRLAGVIEPIKNVPPRLLVKEGVA